VLVDDTVQVPQEYVKNGEIVLNVSYDATSGMKLGNEFIEFKARFAGTAREIIVPVNRVLAIYARENGQGMAFPMPVANAQASAESPSKTQTPTPRKTLSSVEPSSSERKPTDDEPPTPPPAGGRPSLTRVK
jgi:stringent starvation protein B